eukprot:scaffold1332_cov137-Skeletonema_menzelii.AAC.15
MKHHQVSYEASATSRFAGAEDISFCTVHDSYNKQLATAQTHIHDAHTVIKIRSQLVFNQEPGNIQKCGAADKCNLRYFRQNHTNQL